MFGLSRPLGAKHVQIAYKFSFLLCLQPYLEAANVLLLNKLPLWLSLVNGMKRSAKFVTCAERGKILGRSTCRSHTKSAKKNSTRKNTVLASFCTFCKVKIT